ncbi:MAG: hypothetical protein J4432_01110 [DPANN group archaeon]|nr:hypothetical protein [DPANN group archaeon]
MNTTQLILILIAALLVYIGYGIPALVLLGIAFMVKEKPAASKAGAAGAGGIAPIQIPYQAPYTIPEKMSMKMGEAKAGKRKWEGPMEDVAGGLGGIIGKLLGRAVSGGKKK